MNVQKDVLGVTFNCECGNIHSIPTKHYIYSPDALKKIPEILFSQSKNKSVILIADENTYLAAGKLVEKILQNSGWNVQLTIIPKIENNNPVCNDLTFNNLNKIIGNADVFLAVGSGVVNDLTKWLSFERKVPYAVVATAASMNGYTAANVAPTIKGVKSLIRAQAPFAVFVNPEIIISAPYELTASGLGDLIAKPMSTTDWIMNNKFFGEHFCERCSSLINKIEPLYFNNPEKVKKRNPEAIEALVIGLIYTGFAMTMIGVSAPASGGEHLFSHTLDMMSSVDGLPHDLHGRQVGIGTIISAALYEKILLIDKPKIHEMPKEIDVKFWGNISGAIAEQYSAKQEKLQIMREKLLSNNFWTKLTPLLKKNARTAKQIAECLGKAGAARMFDDINCSTDRAMTALLHSHEIRKRPTVIDLAWTLGILPGSAEDIFKEYFL